MIVAAVSALLAMSGVHAQAPNSSALDYPLKDFHTGKAVTLNSLKGKYKAIFVDSFAAWCPDCRHALPGVIELHDELATKGVLFVGLDVWDDYAPMQKMIAQKHIPYLVLHDPKKKNGITDLLGIKNIPTVLILDGNDLSEKARFVDEKEIHVADEIAALKSLGVSTK
jgi:thiol-disulfide isomerase/thioredoxin